MDMRRRKLMAGTLGGVALASLGVTSWSFGAPLSASQRLTLLLPASSPGAAILRGAHAASVAPRRLQVLSLPDAPGLPETTAALESLAGETCLGVLPEAQAIVLLEWARSTGKSLLWMGLHACSASASQSLRHELSTSSPEHSPGKFLSARLASLQHEYFLTERFMHASASISPASSVALPELGGTQRRPGNWLEALGAALVEAALITEARQDRTALLRVAGNAGMGKAAGPQGHFASVALQL